MLRDYVKVQNFFKKLDAHTVKTYGKHLFELDYTGDSAPAYVLKNSDFYERYQEFLTEVGIQNGKVEKNPLKEKISKFEKGVMALKANSEGVPKKKEFINEIKTEELSPVVEALVKKYFNNLDVKHSLDDLSEDDLFNILTLLSINQLGSYIILRYNELGYFNNKTISKDVFYTYDGILQECRSLVIDLRDMKVVSLPYSKFRNMGETSGDNSEFSVASVMKRVNSAKLLEFADKLDGSFIQITDLLGKTITMNNGKSYDYIITSSKHIDEDISPIITYARNYYEANPSYSKLIHENKDYTFMFELIDMRDKHVVSYKKEDSGIYLIGARNKIDGTIMSYHDVIELAKKYNIRSTTLFSGTYEEMLSTLNKYMSYEKEGYVMNIDGFLVKVKCDDYLATARLYDLKSSFNTVIELYFRGRIDDFYTALPDNLKETIDDYISEITTYETLISNFVEKHLNYMLNSPDIKLENATEYLKTIPKTYRGYVSNKYYNIKRGKDDTNYYLLASNRKPLSDEQINCINGKELRERIKELTELLS